MRSNLWHKTDVEKHWNCALLGENETTQFTLFISVIVRHKTKQISQKYNIFKAENRSSLSTIFRLAKFHEDI